MKPPPPPRQYESTRQTQAAAGAESWKRAAEVTQNLKQRIEMMKVSSPTQYERKDEIVESWAQQIAGHGAAMLNFSLGLFLSNSLLVLHAWQLQY